MKKNIKIAITSMSLLASTAMLAPLATPVHAADTTAVATASTEAKSETQSVSMSITKTGTTTASEAAVFLGKTAQVTVQNGKVTSITLHVDGSAFPAAKGQDMSKLLSDVTLNGVEGKQENVAKDGSSLDYVFSGDAYKAGKGTMSFTINAMGTTMKESADVTFGEISASSDSDAKTENAATTTASTDKKTETTTKKAKKSSKKTKKAAKSKKSKKATKKVRKLTHNAYEYNKKGKRANKKVLKKGKKVTTYGKTVKIHKKAFYSIGKGLYVKKANF